MLVFANYPSYTTTPSRRQYYSRDPAPYELDLGLLLGQEHAARRHREAEQVEAFLAYQQREEVERRRREAEQVEAFLNQQREAVARRRQEAEQVQAFLTHQREEVERRRREAKVEAFLARHYGHHQQQQEAQRRRELEAEHVRLQQKREKELELRLMTFLLSSAILGHQQEQEQEQQQPTTEKPGASAWYAVPRDKVYENEAASFPRFKPREHLRRRAAMRRPSEPQPTQQQQPPKEKEVNKDAPLPVDPALSRKSSLSSLGLIRAEYDLLKMSQAPPAEDKEKKAYEAQLLKFLERVDGVESEGDDSVRSIRRSLAKDLQAELDKVEEHEGKKVRFDDEVKPVEDVVVSENTTSAAPVEEEVVVVDSAPAVVENPTPVEVAESVAIEIADSNPVEVVDSTPVDADPAPVATPTTVGEDVDAVAVAVPAEATPVEHTEETTITPTAPIDVVDVAPVATAESAPAKLVDYPITTQTIVEEPVATDDITQESPSVIAPESSKDGVAVDNDVEVHSVSSESEAGQPSDEFESDVGEDVVLLKSDGEEEVGRKVGGYELL